MTLAHLSCVSKEIKIIKKENLLNSLFLWSRDKSHKNWGCDSINAGFH